MERIKNYYNDNLPLAEQKKFYQYTLQQNLIFKWSDILGIEPTLAFTTVLQKLQQAAEQNSTHAQLALANAYYLQPAFSFKQKISSTEQLKLVSQLLMSAAKQNLAEAQVTLALLWSIHPNQKLGKQQSLSYLTQAAVQGETFAQTMLQKNHDNFNKASDPLLPFDWSQANLTAKDCNHSPLISIYQQLIPPLLCEYIKFIAKPHLQPAQILAENDQQLEYSQTRSNQTMSIYGDINNISLMWLEKQLAQIASLPIYQAEHSSVLCYALHQEYVAHHDYFIGDDHLTQSLLNDGGQRQKSIVCYLNNDFEGGETFFPELDIKISPQQGSALIFESCNDTEKCFAESLHASLPVKQGTKWALVKWFRNRETFYGAALT